MEVSITMMRSWKFSSWYCPSALSARTNTFLLMCIREEYKQAYPSPSDVLLDHTKSSNGHRTLINSRIDAIPIAFESARDPLSTQPIISTPPPPPPPKHFFQNPQLSPNHTDGTKLFERTSGTHIYARLGGGRLPSKIY